MSGADAVEKLEAGADLVQIYTGLIYHGPGLIKECARALSRQPKPEARPARTPRKDDGFLFSD